MRRGNWISGGLALTLIFSLAGCSLAQPEREGPEQDEFIGYHLVYEPIPAEGEEILIEDENWVEYGSEPLDLGAYGSTEIPQKILIGELQDNGSYLFPGKEGLNFFFPVYMAGYGENEHEVRLSYSQLELTRQSSQTEDAGDSYRYAGVACYGLPQGAAEWPEGQAAEYGWRTGRPPGPSISPETETGTPERGEILGLGRSGFWPRNSMGRPIRSPAWSSRWTFRSSPVWRPSPSSSTTAAIGF